MTIDEQKKAIFVYLDEILPTLSKEDFGRFVMIEPESKKFFIGDFFGDCYDEYKKVFGKKCGQMVKVGDIDYDNVNDIIFHSPE